MLEMPWPDTIAQNKARCLFIFIFIFCVIPNWKKNDCKNFGKKMLAYVEIPFF